MIASNLSAFRTRMYVLWKLLLRVSIVNPLWRRLAAPNPQPQLGGRWDRLQIIRRRFCRRGEGRGLRDPKLDAGSLVKPRIIPIRPIV